MTLTLQFLSANKICEIQVSRQPLRVSLPLIWFRAGSKSFYQITKNPNCTFDTNKHSNNCLSGRSVTDAADLTRNYDSEGYIGFSVAKPGVCPTLHPVKQFQFLGYRLARENSFSFYVTGANVKSKIAPELPGVCYSWELSQTKTSLVDIEHKAIQWHKHSTAGTSDDHPKRYFPKRVESTMQRNLNRGETVNKKNKYTTLMF